MMPPVFLHSLRVRSWMQGLLHPGTLSPAERFRRCLPLLIRASISFAGFADQAGNPEDAALHQLSTGESSAGKEEAGAPIRRLPGAHGHIVFIGRNCSSIEPGALEIGIGPDRWLCMRVWRFESA